MTDIKETLDIFTAVKSLKSAYDLAMEDGKIDIFDFRYLADPISAVREAIKDIGKVKEELSDLDKEEIELLITTALELIMAVIDALEKN